MSLEHHWVIVRCEGPEGFSTRPTRAHLSLEEARTEAARLAKQHVGETFAICRVHPTELVKATLTLETTDVGKL